MRAGNIFLILEDGVSCAATVVSRHRKIAKIIKNFEKYLMNKIDLSRENYRTGKIVWTPKKVRCSMPSAQLRAEYHEEAVSASDEVRVKAYRRGGADRVCCARLFCRPLRSRCLSECCRHRASVARCSRKPLHPERCV